MLYFDIVFTLAGCISPPTLILELCDNHKSPSIIRCSFVDIFDLTFRFAPIFKFPSKLKPDFNFILPWISTSLHKVIFSNTLTLPNTFKLLFICVNKFMLTHLSNPVFLYIEPELYCSPALSPSNSVFTTHAVVSSLSNIIEPKIYFKVLFSIIIESSSPNIFDIFILLFW